MILKILQGFSYRFWENPPRNKRIYTVKKLQPGSTMQIYTLPDDLPSDYSLERRNANSVQIQENIEEIDRLVDLTFIALLRRKPDRDTLLAYREGFANGTTFHDLIDDVIGSDEYRSVRLHRTASANVSETTPGSEGSEDLPATVALLTTRLVEKGWRPQISALAKADRVDDGDGRRMRSLRVTLSVLDQL